MSETPRLDRQAIADLYRGLELTIGHGYGTGSYPAAMPVIYERDGTQRLGFVVEGGRIVDANAGGRAGS